MAFTKMKAKAAKMLRKGKFAKKVEDKKEEAAEEKAEAKGKFVPFWAEKK